MTTLSDYLVVTKNLANYQKLEQSKPEVAAATKYYQQNISSIKTPQDLVSNYRLFSYVLNAYGLGDDVHEKALYQKILQQGTGSSADLAYRLNDTRKIALAKDFNFPIFGPATTATSYVQKDVVNKYIEQQLETDQGNQNPGVQLALYFKANASNITSVYNVLADKQLLTVVQTALGISSATSGEPIDTQAKLIGSKLNVADFKDPVKLDKFLQKFAAQYDITNGNTSSNSPGSGALTILGGGGGNAGNSILSILHNG